MSTALAELRRQGTRLAPQDVIDGFAELFSQIGDATRHVGGTIGFRVHGQGGGCWVVDLSQPGGAWKRLDDPTDLEACDTRIYAFARVFPAILLDPESVVGLRETGEVVVQGRRQKLTKLSRLIGTGGSTMNVRAAGGM